MSEILVIQNRPGIGDMCIFLTYIRNIAKKNENSKITLLTKKRTSAIELLNDDDCIHKVYYIDKYNSLKEKSGLFNKLKKKNFSKVYIFHYGIKFYILSKLLNIKKIFHYGFLKKNENIVKKAESATSSWLNSNDIKFNPILKLKKKNKFSDKNLITIGIGGSGFSKKWPIENYINLISLIIKNNNFNFLIAGGYGEISDANKIINYFTDKNIKINSLCELSILECMNKIINSKLYIGNDTSFMHLSGCLGVKAFGLFGDTPPNNCDYNDNITPITPQNIKNIGHDSFAMKMIKPYYVYQKIFNE